jgi:hypothetical protein
LTNTLKNKTMGLVKEPEGIDFLIKSRPLTKKEEELLSKFIREEKAKRTKKISSRKATAKRTISIRKKTTAKEV